jgi:hypothetical protein
MRYHLAQINIGKFLKPVNDPANADFVNNLARVNAAAEGQPGFIWRLKGEGDSAIDIQPFDDPHIGINMSVWADIDSLVAFTYREPAHRDIMKRRREWFDRMEFYMALWWIPEGAVPTIEEGKAKIALLSRIGPSPEAFTFRQPFAAPHSADIARPRLAECT